MNGTSTTPPAAANGTHSLDADIALLSSVFLQSVDLEGRDVEGPELQELLKRLEAADGVAQGVESRLDDIIGNLDRMLSGLETTGEEKVDNVKRGGDEGLPAKEGSGDSGSRGGSKA